MLSKWDPGYNFIGSREEKDEKVSGRLEGIAGRGYRVGDSPTLASTG